MIQHLVFGYETTQIFEHVIKKNAEYIIFKKKSNLVKFASFGIQNNENFKILKNTVFC